MTLYRYFYFLITIFALYFLELTCCIANIHFLWYNTFAQFHIQKVGDCMEIRYSKQALKTLIKLDKATQQRIRHGIDGLTHKPPVGDIKLLQGIDNSYRLRIGKYRIIYHYTTENTCEILFIDQIGSRGDVYK